MKIKTNKLVLSAALKDAAKATSSKGSYPVLSGIKFTADKGVSLTGSDLELTIIRTVPAEVMEPGSLIVPTRIAELIDRLPSGVFTIESKDDTSAIIKYGDSEAVINGYNADEYPEPPVAESKISFELLGETLKDAITRVVNMAADQHSNAVLTGVALEISESTLTVAATDAHRLGYASIELAAKPGDVKTVIPKKAMFEIVKLLKPTDKITVVVGESVVAFKTDGLSITTRVLGGTYPAYKRLVPTDLKTKLKINTVQLKNSVERASLVSANGASLVTLEYAGGKLIVSQNNECGKLREEFAVDIEGENFKQNFNARYLTDMLRFTPSEEIQLAYTGELTPLVMIPADLKSIAILLPVRPQAPAAEAA